MGYNSSMKLVAQTITVALAVCATGYSQAPSTAPKLEFEAVSIKAGPPQVGHFRLPGSATGGPGTADPALFRCSSCNLALLIAKAFELQRYQFPGQSALPDAAYDVMARVPEGTTPEQFQTMLQGLLKERFGLAYHFDKKQLQGYELVVSKGGPKLKQSEDKPKAEPRPENSWHGGGGGAAGGAGHEHSGAMVFNGQGRFRGDHLTMADLVRLIATQLAKPVDDNTGLTGKYDISLNWSDDGSRGDASHAASGGAGGGFDHGGAGGGSPQSGTGAFSGPNLIGALPAQLGLKLEPAKATANVFVIDRIEKAPSAN